MSFFSFEIGGENLVGSFRSFEGGYGKFKSYRLLRGCYGEDKLIVLEVVRR